MFIHTSVDLGSTSIRLVKRTQTTVPQHPMLQKIHASKILLHVIESNVKWLIVIRTRKLDLFEGCWIVSDWGTSWKPSFLTPSLDTPFLIY